MIVTTPDLKWYTGMSSQREVPPRCPHANVHRCNRYYSSIYLLGELNITTKMVESKVADLDKYWEGSGLIPVIEEHDPEVGHDKGKLTSVSKFCPEVSFEFYGLFAESMYKYVDNIDEASAHRRLSFENKTASWRWDWMSLKSTHYTDCQVYSQLPYNNKNEVKTEDIFEMKPGFMGFSLNLMVLYQWIKRRISNKSSE